MDGNRKQQTQIFRVLYDTYDDAKKARENFEGKNEFYKQGNDKNYSIVLGKELIRKPKGKGTITQRSNGTWRRTLIKNGKRVFDKTFQTYEEADDYRTIQVNKPTIEASVKDANKKFPNINIELKQ